LGRRPLGKFIDYLRQSRPFADKMYVISHNSRGYDARFLLRKFLELIWTPQLITDGTKILSMIVENLYFLVSLNFLSMSLKGMPKSLDLTFKKGIVLTFQHGQQFGICGPLSCQAMSERNFWNGMRSKETKVSAISRSCWPTAWTMSMY